MIEIDIPGFKLLRIEHLVLDFNGTIARDGLLIEGVGESLNALANKLTIHVITADTFGKAEAQLEGVKCKLSILPPENQDKAKMEYVKKLNPEKTISIGNGRNDHLMLEASAIGIAVIQDEGAASKTLQSADVVCKNIDAALSLLTDTLRLRATLRS